MKALTVFLLLLLALYMWEIVEDVAEGFEDQGGGEEELEGGKGKP
jgi:hypothetical protein